MVGQDKGELFGFAGRGGGSKGGDAGSRSKPGEDVAFIRHVPKFLQAHAHMLNKAVEEEPEAAALAAKYDDGGRDDEGDEEEEQEALRRAIEQDPSLVAQHPELQSVADSVEADKLKAQGNTAYAAKKYEEAERVFAHCIDLDGSNHVYWSNRAAARCELKDWRGAAADARRCTQLKPGWAKGWSRLGAAYYGLEQYTEAREAYERAVKLEPNDTTLAISLQKASSKEAKQISEGKHVFKRKLGEEEGGGGRGGGGEKRQQTVRTSAAKKEKTLLSFGEEEGEG